MNPTPEVTKNQDFRNTQYLKLTFKHTKYSTHNVQSYVKVASDTSKPNNQRSVHNEDNESALLKFIDEMKSIITPLISLLTSVNTN